MDRRTNKGETIGPRPGGRGPKKLPRNCNIPSFEFFFFIYIYVYIYANQGRQ